MKLMFFYFKHISMSIYTLVMGVFEIISVKLFFILKLVHTLLNAEQFACGLKERWRFKHIICIMNKFTFLEGSRRIKKNCERL